MTCDIQFDTGSYFLVVPDRALKEDFFQTFDCGTSNTCSPYPHHKINITYGTSRAHGYLIQDQIDLNSGLRLTSEAILLAQEWPRGPKTTIDGIFGLGYKRKPENFMNSLGLGHIEDSSYNLVKTLKRQGHIEKSQFMFFLDDDLSETGNLKADFMIGGYKNKYKKGDMIFLDVVSDNQWAIRLNSVKIGRENMKITSGRGMALLDTGTSVITFPQKVYKYVESYIVENTPCKEIKNLFCICDNGKTCHVKAGDFPDIVLELDGMKTLLKGEAYARETGKGTMIEVMRFDAHHDMVILGDTFIRQYLTLFDVENGKIGLAPSINFKGDSRTVKMEKIFI